ncbi:MAG: flagellar motor protein MotB [Bacteroidetes bacterium]|nr:MAG: flagellar motor protein MotB [Bacteroidota bacterium]
MKITKKTVLYLGILAIIGVTSCVPARKYEDLLERRQNCEDQNNQLRIENEELLTESTELFRQRDNLEERVEQLRRDTTEIGRINRRLETNYDRLLETYENLLDQNQKLMDGQEIEATRILRRLKETQEDLQRREDELRRATAQMEEKERNLNNLIRELGTKEERVEELESILARQDSVVRELRRKVSTALLGFEGQGLTVEIKNGKVYVSLEESLLFATGSTQVDSRGVRALRELAKVLEANPEINVLIEGHTDDVPFRPGSAIKDNWDLSVLRATAIVRILLQNAQLDPQRLTAAGRGEYMPIDPAKTPEARKKNRRTEIILTPQLDDLFQIIEIN